MKKELFFGRDSQESGVSRTAILFHGLSGSPDEVEDLGRFLHSHGYTVIIPLLSGHGESIDKLRKTPETAWIEDAEKAFQRAVELGDESISLLGLSMGGLLALHLSEVYSSRVSKLVLMSTPLRFQSSVREYALQLLALLSNSLLNRLGLVKKEVRDAEVFRRERLAFTHHSIASAARLVKLRKMVLRDLSKISAPVLYLQDPEDHHLSIRVPEILEEGLLNTRFQMQWFPGGQHELTIGHRADEVFEVVLEFLNSKA